MGRNTRWLVRCICGVEKEVATGHLRSGNVTSCGRCRNKKHGMTGSKLFIVWVGIRDRCRNERARAYKNYGGRGIRFADRWNDFATFREDILREIGDVVPGLSLDRIDNDGHYEPGNVRWATRTQQNRNRRGNVFLECNGEKMTMAEWSERTGIRIGTLWKRIADGWSVERSLTVPIRLRKKQ